MGVDLEICDLDVRYGEVRALRGVSLHARTGELIALLGTNGGGKSTLINTVSGFVRQRSGSVRLEGKSVDTLEPFQRVRAGVVQVSQRRDLFPGLSVLDNLQLGAVTRKDAHARRQRLQEVLSLFPHLEQRMLQRVDTMSGGEQQMVAFARALMSEPRLLLLDEPTAGLAPIYVKILEDAMRELRRRGITMLLVEHSTSFALALADRFYVLRDGEMVFSGKPADLSDDREQFLGALMLGIPAAAAPDGQR